MSDLMLFGALRMPMPQDPQEVGVVEWIQFCSRARQAADRIEADAAEIAALKARIAALVEARRRHIEATKAYNAKLEEAKKAREGNDWSIAPHDAFRAMGKRHREFIAAAQDLADAAIEAARGE